MLGYGLLLGFCLGLDLRFGLESGFYVVIGRELFVGNYLSMNVLSVKFRRRI